LKEKKCPVQPRQQDPIALNNRGEKVDVGGVQVMDSSERSRCGTGLRGGRVSKGGVKSEADGGGEAVKQKGEADGR